VATVAVALAPVRFDHGLLGLDVGGGPSHAPIAMTRSFGFEVVIVSVASDAVAVGPEVAGAPSSASETPDHSAIWTAASSDPMKLTTTLLLPPAELNPYP